MPEIKAIIFDCFGVLVEDALRAMNDQLAIQEPAKAAEVRELVRQTMAGLLGPEDSNCQIAALFGLDVDAYRRQVRRGELRNQPLLNRITKLRREYKTGLLSNVSRGGLTRRFSPAELTGWFDVVVASAEIGIAKPDPRAFGYITDKLAVAAGDCVFIDDTADYVAAAEALGMRGIVYRNFKQFSGELDTLLNI